MGDWGLAEYSRFLMILPSGEVTATTTCHCQARWLALKTRVFQPFWSVVLTVVIEGFFSSIPR